MDQPPESLLRWVVETTPDGLFFADDSGTVTWANAAAAGAVGRRPSELVGTPVTDLLVLDTDTAEAVRIREPRVINLETFLRHADGTHVPVLSTSVRLPDHLGEQFRWLLRVTQYGGREELVERLRTRERQLADAQEIAHLGSWTWDPVTDDAQWSEEMYRIAGRSPLEWAPSLPALLELIHPDDRELAARSLLSVAEGAAETFSFEARAVRPDGEVRWFRGLGRRQVTEGRVTLSGTAQDITDLKHADEEAVEANRRLTVLQGMAAAANRAATLAEAVSVAATRILPSGSGRWTPLAVHVPVPGGSLVPLMELDGPVPVDDDLIARTRASQAIEVQPAPGELAATHTMVCVPVVARGEVVCVISTLADEPELDDNVRILIEQVAIQLGVVAERERSAADLAEARDQAMEASRLKSDFLATMSHEIRTPMNGVIGLTDLLRRTTLDEHQQRLVDGLRGAGLTLMGILNDVLDLSKIEAGKLELELADFDFRTVLDRTAAVFGPRAHEKGLELVVASHPAVPPILRGDAVRLGQVLTNLTSNAVKFTDRGEVVVEATIAEETAAEVVLRVAVSDTGVGIAPSGRESLFDAFTQADPSTTSRHGGTGLGLAISRQLVHALGGAIEVSSELGRGSRFTFTARFTKSSAAAAAADPVPIAGRRVLVVDDNQSSRRILTEQLDSWGLRPVAVATAAEAVATLHEAVHDGDPFDAALLDLLLPDSDGLALARRIRAEAALAGALLLLLSPDQAVGAGAAREAGCDTALSKPVRCDELLEVLVALLAPGSVPDAAPDADDLRIGPQAEPHGLRVLVVEDNPVNQLVATGLLESSGYEVDVASDGVEAVERLSGGHDYAAVLMDCRMPRMDGFDATRAVRRNEPSGRHVPILAMTASALEGERERCLAAGMDDFLTKPVDPADLFAALRRWTGAEPQRAPERPVRPRRAAPEPVLPPEPTGLVLDPDRVAMLDELRKDGVSFFVRTARSFLGRIDEEVQSIRDAIDGADADRAAGASHRLKGSAANLGVNRVSEAARRIEGHARGGATTGAEGLLADLDHEVQRAVAALREALDE